MLLSGGNLLSLENKSPILAQVKVIRMGILKFENKIVELRVKGHTHIFPVLDFHGHINSAYIEKHYHNPIAEMACIHKILSMSSLAMQDCTITTIVITSRICLPFC